MSSHFKVVLLIVVCLGLLISPSGALRACSFTVAAQQYEFCLTLCGGDFVLVDYCQSYSFAYNCFYGGFSSAWCEMFSQPFDCWELIYYQQTYTQICPHA